MCVTVPGFYASLPPGKCLLILFWVQVGGGVGERDTPMWISPDSNIFSHGSTCYPQ